MATYYKYAERSADSQINWAEVGKDMSDMLKEETRIREEKKSAIDAASREFGNTLANPPQGEHKGANQWALEYGDNAAQFMLMQDRLLKSGQMKLKDYTIARQNILDGTDRAFNLTKDYQAVFADKMERYKTDKSQDLEQWLMGQAEGYSDFNKSQLYINPTDGTVSVAMKELKKVDGKDVYVMNTNPNEFTSINTLKNQIAGKYDKYNTNIATDAFVKGLGENVTSAIAKTASLSAGGLILNVEDIRNRKDIDPTTKEILYKFSDSENQFIKGSLANPYDRLSVLTNSQKFAPNKLQYGFTYKEEEAKANPNKILLKVDPSSGQPIPEFSEEQMKVSEDFMRTELRAKYKRTEELKTTPQVQLQERRAPSEAEINRAERNKQQLEAAGAWNQLYTGGTPADKQSAAETLIGLPSAKEMGLLKVDLASKPGTVILKYADSKLNREIPMKGRTFEDFAASGVELHGVTDKKKASQAGTGNKVYGDVDFTGVTAGRAGAEPAPIVIPVDVFKAKSDKSAEDVQKLLPNGYIAEDTGGFFGNTVKITAPDGTEIDYKSDVTSPKDIITQKAKIENFLKPKTGTTGGVGAKY